MKTEIFAPPLVPTGKDYADNGTFGRKNAVYLDICAAYMAGTIFCYVWVFLLAFMIIGYLTNWDFYAFVFFFILPQIIFIPAAIYTIFKSPPLPNMRLNRQRREVYIWLNKEKRGWIVPWETIGAKGKEVVTLSQAGRSTQAIMGVYANDPMQGKEIAVFSVMTGTMNVARAQWEAIRRFMELGSEHCPDSILGYQHPIKDGIIGRCWRQIKQGELLYAFGNLLAIIFLGAFMIDIYNYYKLRDLPDFDDPAIQAWSMPLPPEEWVQPSASLIEAIKQQEQKLMTEGNYKAEDCQYYHPETAGGETQAT